MKKIYWIAISLFVGSCAATRYVEPLDKGELSVGANFGGPVIEFGGAPIPVPLTRLEVGYGIDSNFTIHGALHTTASFFGNVQLDVGLTYQFLEQKKWVPNLSVSPSFNFIYNFDASSARLWPILDVNAFWNYGKRSNYWYVGCNNYFELQSNMANDQEQRHHWLFSPQIGHVIKGKKHPWRLRTEIKILAPYVNNSTAFIPYKSLTGQWGATAFFIGFNYPIQLKK